MSRILWSTVAANDLERIALHIRQDHPGAALRVSRVIYDGVRHLSRFPYRGRLGRVPNTRELVFAPWPYIVVYRIYESGDVRILRVRHAAQQWP